MKDVFVHQVSSPTTNELEVQISNVTEPKIEICLKHLAPELPSAHHPERAIEIKEMFAAKVDEFLAANGTNLDSSWKIDPHPFQDGDNALAITVSCDLELGQQITFYGPAMREDQIPDFLCKQFQTVLHGMKGG